VERRAAWRGASQGGAAGSAALRCETAASAARARRRDASGCWAGGRRELRGGAASVRRRALGGSARAGAGAAGRQEVPISYCNQAAARSNSAVGNLPRSLESPRPRGGTPGARRACAVWLPRRRAGRGVLSQDARDKAMQASVAARALHHCLPDVSRPATRFWREREDSAPPLTAARGTPSGACASNATRHRFRSRKTTPT
jgi:hypothetical protein